jgi:hypothetical protein
MAMSDGSTSDTEHFNLKEADGIPEFIERGERAELGSWDYYECPGCGEPICSFCDCPNEDCRWYDGDDWREAIRKTARDHGDIYIGSLEVPADA